MDSMLRFEGIEKVGGRAEEIWKRGRKDGKGGGGVERLQETERVKAKRKSIYMIYTSATVRGRQELSFIYECISGKAPRC